MLGSALDVYDHFQLLMMTAQLSSTDGTFISVCQVRLYDTSSQRRPVISVDFRESPIKAVVEDPDGHTVYIGTGTGDLASFDMRTGMISTRSAVLFAGTQYFWKQVECSFKC
jgi:hypothetical protein